MSVDSIPPEAKAMIGRETTPQTYEVTKAHIRHFALAIGDYNPLYRDEDYASKTKWNGIIAPPLFVFAFTYEEPVSTELREDGLPEYTEIDVPLPASHVIGGSSDVELGEPVRPGDKITVKKKVSDIYSRQGTKGTLFFTVIETAYINQNGQSLATEKATIISR